MVASADLFASDYKLTFVYCLQLCLDTCQLDADALRFLFVELIHHAPKFTPADLQDHRLRAAPASEACRTDAVCYHLPNHFRRRFDVHTLLLVAEDRKKFPVRRNSRAGCKPRKFHSADGRNPQALI